MPEGKSPRSATIRLIPCSLYCFSSAATFSLEDPTHDKCGAASSPAALISSTVDSVPSWVVPPAPNVTEKNSGFLSDSFSRVARSFSAPSSVFAGEKLKADVHHGLFIHRVIGLSQHRYFSLRTQNILDCRRPLSTRSGKNLSQSS